MLTFGAALELLKAGQKVRRVNWISHLALQVPDANSKMTRKYLYAESPSGLDRFPWVPFTQDLLAEDWEVVE